MKTKYVVIGIIAVLIIIGIIFVSIYIGKECKTESDCITKNCFTIQCKDNKCIYSPVINCCGNERCEINETYPECAVDCPSCDDFNNCTIDKYDYHEQECVNEPIIPCCGNGICDENVETYLNCSTDCPDCIDDNKLTTDSFNYEIQKCENPVTHYFFDDFESGIENWEFYAAEGEASWSTMVEEDGNTILKGVGHISADPGEEARDDYSFKFRFKRIEEGSFGVNFRFSEMGRYLVDGGDETIRLHRRFSENPGTVGEADFIVDENWHTFEIRGYDNILNIYIDNELLIKYKDEGQGGGPLLSGKAGFENGDGTEFWIDDVEIKLITEEDIIYP